MRTEEVAAMRAIQRKTLDYRNENEDFRTRREIQNKEKNMKQVCRKNSRLVETAKNSTPVEMGRPSQS